MSAATKAGVGPALADLYPPFRRKMAEYERLAQSDEQAAGAVFAEAQEIAAAWRAGVEYGRSMKGDSIEGGAD
jgi:hypothetical protein